ncbi:Rieske (2Fe-2S) protein [Streptomyces wedmorensis]
MPMSDREIHDTPTSAPHDGPSRRGVVLGLLATTGSAVGLCATSGCSKKKEPEEHPEVRAGSEPKPGAKLLPIDKIPAEGTIIQEAGIVVLGNPHDGFRAFSAYCTHQGCMLSDISSDALNCPCHGSRFDLTTGEPLSGPARKPLPRVKVRVAGEHVVIE